MLQESNAAPRSRVRGKSIGTYASIQYNSTYQCILALQRKHRALKGKALDSRKWKNTPKCEARR